MIGVAGFLFLFCAIIFFKPDMWGYFLEKPNFEVANGLKTPAHIAPVWYFTPSTPSCGRCLTSCWASS